MGRLNQVSDYCLQIIILMIESDASYLKLCLTGDQILIGRLRRMKSIGITANTNTPIFWPSELLAYCQSLESLSFFFEKHIKRGYFASLSSWSGSTSLRKLVLGGSFSLGTLNATLSSIVPNLEELHLRNIEEECSTWLIPLPPRLRRLEAFQSTLPGLGFLDSLPPTLEYLDTDSLHTMGSVPWPAKLTFLRLGYRGVSSRLFSQLPSTLTHLSITRRPLTNDYDDIESVIPWLPASLTSLELVSCPVGRKIPDADCLPQRLSHLVLDCDVDLPEHDVMSLYWKSLPNLTSMHIRIAGSRIFASPLACLLDRPIKEADFASSASEYIWIPRSMERLQLNVQDSQHLPCTFPPALRDLSIWSSRPEDLVLTTPLPSKLTKLYLNGFFPEEIECGFFPETLRSLKIFSNAFADPSRGFASLPRSLTSLHFTNDQPPLVNRHHILFYEQSKNVNELPPSLTSLQIETQAFPTCIYDWISLLPSSLPLEEFIFRSRELQDAEVGPPPPTIWPDWPQTLRHLSVSVAQLDPSNLAKLPSHLRSLSLFLVNGSSSMIQREHVLQLPRTLTQLELPCDATVVPADFQSFTFRITYRTHNQHTFFSSKL